MVLILGERSPEAPSAEIKPTPIKPEEQSEWEDIIAKEETKNRLYELHLKDHANFLKESQRILTENKDNERLALIITSRTYALTTIC